MNRKLGYIIFLTAAISAFAQSGTLIGSWLLTKAEIKSETVHPYQVFEFKKDGKLLAMGYEMGTWQYDAAHQTMVLTSKVDKDFNGTGKITQLSAEQFTMNKNGEIYYYERMHPERTAQNNKQAGLDGIWKLSGTDYPFAVLQVTLPEDFKVVQASDSETDRSSGTWMYRPDEQAVIFIGFSHLLRGKAELSEKKADSFTLTLGKRILKAERVKESANTIERLTFTEDDFPEEAEADESQLPWRDPEPMAEFLNGVASLHYSYGTLVDGYPLLKYTSSLCSKLSADPMKPRINFTNFYITDGDTIQTSEKVRSALEESRNAFFPQNEPWPYRIKGVEQVTVPAGTFTCTVIEGIDMDKKIKFWMINDMPGIYAKIIVDTTDPFGKPEYSVQELVKIDYQNKK